MSLSIYGGTGFIGSKYCELFSGIKINKNDDLCNTNKILYFISTVTNYNILTNHLLDIETNLVKLLKVLNANKHKKDLEFNFISSWFVYGKTSLPANEDANCNPKGFYSITKRCAEQLIISYCETFGIKYRILRLCNVIGESDKGVSNKKNALQNMIYKLSKNESIQLYDEGSHIRDYMYVDDVCSAINICINKGELNTIYNIGSGEPHTIKEMIDYCINKLNSRSKIKSMKPPMFHKIVQTKHILLDVEKLNKLNFKRKYTLWESLDKIMENL